jgi:site-specific recombinase XerD
METEQAVKQFESYLHRRYGDRSTPKHYMSDLGIFLRHVGAKPLAQITVHDIDSFVASGQEQGWGSKTVNRRLATLRSFFDYLASEEPERYPINPIRWRRHKVKEGQALPRDASDEEVSRLLAVIDDLRDATIFGLMVGAGLRVGEVIDLRVVNLTAPAEADGLARLRVLGKGRKERIVWITPLTYGKVNRWLAVRPVSQSDHLFLNQHRRPLSQSGVEYRLKQYCQRAGVYLSCHQLRHTFARRLAEQKMPVEGIGKLLGHSQIATTQRYIAGADPDLREAFEQAMNSVEQAATAIQALTPIAPVVRPPRQLEQANPAHLTAALAHFAAFPAWLQEPLSAYLRRRWHQWKPSLAGDHAQRLARRLSAIWRGLLACQPLAGWADLQRQQVAVWLETRQQAGLALSSQRQELSELMSFLHFVVDQDQPVNPQVFRIAYPETPEPLPRHLTNEEFQRLVQTVGQATTAGTPQALLAWTWFSTLIATGLRLNELLDLRLSDLDLAGARIFIRQPKNRQDRVVFLTPSLQALLHRYLAQRPASPDDHLWQFGTTRLNADHVRHQLRRWGQDCNVHVTPHRLRHTFATQLINHGLPLTFLAKLLGHTSFQMTLHYARLYDATVADHFQAAMAAIEGIAVSNWPMPAYDISIPIRDSV